jgi:hypothetical protein
MLQADDEYYSAFPTDSGGQTEGQIHAPALLSVAFWQIYPRARISTLSETFPERLGCFAFCARRLEGLLSGKSIRSRV